MSVVSIRPPLSARRLHRQRILARDGTAGELADLLFDDARWIVRYLVVDNLGPMPRRDILVSPAQVALAAPELRLRLTRDELRRCPDLDEDRPVYLQYGVSGAPRPADAHLRSAEIVLGFAVRERGSAAGRLRDIEVDPERWTVDSLVLDSGIWLPGKRRTIEPRQVESIDWIARTIELR